MVLCLASRTIFFPCHLMGEKVMLAFWLASWISPALCLRIALQTHHSNHLGRVNH